MQNGKYIALGGAYTYTDIIITFFNVYGDLDSLKEYGNDSTLWVHGVENSLQATGTGNYILAGQRCVNWYRDNMLVKFDSNFDTIFTKTYYPVNDNGNKDVLNYNTCIGKDNSYLMVGHTNIDNNYDSLYKYQMQLIKTDTLGNLLWRKTYGNDTYTHYGYKVVNTFDGGYLLGGWCDKNGGDWAIVKTDQNGENPIYKYFGHTTNGEGRIMGITTTKDSCYIITGAYAISTGGIDKARILKLDKNLNIVWDKQYLNIGDVSFFYKALEKENNNLFIYGAERNSLNYKMSTIMELTSEGDSIWKQVTTANNQETSSNNLESGKITPDGGLIFGGYIFDVNLTPYQQMWLVKTDSLGCDGTQWTCNTTHLENTAENKESALRVWPNPVKNELHISFNQKELIKNEKLKIKDDNNSKAVNSLLEKRVREIENTLTKQQFNNLTIDQKLKYNIAHPKQNYWGEKERQQMKELQNKYAIMLPFDAINGKIDIFSIDPALNLKLHSSRYVKNNYTKNADKNIYSSKSKNNETNIIIYDIFGKQILSYKTKLINNSTKINISSLQSGIYFLKINEHVTKFIKKVR